MIFREDQLGERDRERKPKAYKSNESGNAEKPQAKKSKILEEKIKRNREQNREEWNNIWKKPKRKQLGVRDSEREPNPSSKNRKTEATQAYGGEVERCNGTEPRKSAQREGERETLDELRREMGGR